MLKKSRALALAVTTAGLIGFSASVASAATMASQPGSGGTADAGQAPSASCANLLPGNAAPGNMTGAPGLGNGDAFVKGLSTSGSKSTASTGTDCGLTSKQLQALCAGTSPANAMPFGAGGSQLGPFAGIFAMFTQGAVSTASSGCSLGGK
jgi:hypothetical protein